MVSRSAAKNLSKSGNPREVENSVHVSTQFGNGFQTINCIDVPNGDVGSHITDSDVVYNLVTTGTEINGFDADRVSTQDNVVVHVLVFLLTVYFKTTDLFSWHYFQ